MAFKVTPDKILDATVWLSGSEALPFDLWNQVVSFLAEDHMLKDYILINDLVIRVKSESNRTKHSTMTPLCLFKKKNLLPRIHRKTFGSKLQDTIIAFDILAGRKTIAEVLRQ